MQYLPREDDRVLPRRGKVIEFRSNHVGLTGTVGRVKEVSCHCGAPSSPQRLPGAIVPAPCCRSTRLGCSFSLLRKSLSIEFVPFNAQTDFSSVEDRACSQQAWPSAVSRQWSRAKWISPLIAIPSNSFADTTGANIHSLSLKTVAKWRRRATVEDLKTGPKAPRFTTLTEAEEAAVVEFRRHTLLPLDDCLYALQPSIPHLTRSALHRCLQRHGISCLTDIEGDKPKRQRFKSYPIGFFHMDITEAQTAEGKALPSSSKDSTCSSASTAPASSPSPGCSTRLIGERRGSSSNTC